MHPTVIRLIHAAIGMLLMLAMPANARAATVSDGSSLTYADAVVLGAVEGVTEYLPVSSTGHLILTNHLLGLDGEHADASPTNAPVEAPAKIVSAKAIDDYCIVIQAGAIAAVVILYWKDLWLVLLGLCGRSREGFRLGLNLLLAFLPAAILGFIFNDWIEERLFGPIPVAIALALGAPLMLGVEAWRRKKLAANGAAALPERELADITPRQAVFIGLLQSVAMWPGTSRSMMTITGGYLIGLSPAKAARFSFLLGLITLGAATGYTLLRHGRQMADNLDIGPVLVGMVIATITAALSVKWLVCYLSRNGLSLFAYYRIALSVAVIALVCV